MKVDKKFAPITITLETEEDKTFILEVLYKAEFYRRDSWWTMNRQDSDSFSQKWRWVEGLLK